MLFLEQQISEANLGNRSWGHLINSDKFWRLLWVSHVIRFYSFKNVNHLKSVFSFFMTHLGKKYICLKPKELIRPWWNEVLTINRLMFFIRPKHLRLETKSIKTGINLLFQQIFIDCVSHVVGENSIKQGRTYLMFF